MAINQYLTEPPILASPKASDMLYLYLAIRVGNRAGQAGLGRANTGLGQNRAGPKLARFFWAKILVAQLALKTGLVEPNNLLKEKKIERAGPGRAIPSRAILDRAKFGPVFFRANNLMAQPGPNSEWIGLAHRAGPIFPPLLAISDVSMSAALFKEDESRKHKPVFFISKSLSEAKTRYTRLEQKVLALRVATKKLCPYFQAHPIVVLTNLPLRSTIQKPNLSGR